MEICAKPYLHRADCVEKIVSKPRLRQKLNLVETSCVKNPDCIKAIVATLMLFELHQKVKQQS